jgi:general stress protein 26
MTEREYINWLWSYQTEHFHEQLKRDPALKEHWLGHARDRYAALSEAERAEIEAEASHV